MCSMSKEQLLQIPQVVEEIKRHLWIESEQAGYDIGFDNAADDWIKKYSREWLKYYMPEKLEQPKKEEKPASVAPAAAAPVKKNGGGEKEKEAKPARRSAKSYKK
jgi:hypothetical protein